MKMVKGYALPSPDSGDGDYGGFAEFAASPAVAPYWSNSNPALVAPVPRLDGFYAPNFSGCHGCDFAADPLSTEGTRTSRPALMALAGAGAGVLLARNPIFVLLGAVAGYVAGKAMSGETGIEKSIRDARERAEEASLNTVPNGAALAGLLPSYTDDNFMYRQQYVVPQLSAYGEEQKLFGGSGAFVGAALGLGLLYYLSRD